MNKEKRILIVDEDKASRDMLLSLLEQEGFEDLVSASNGFESITLLEEYVVDLVIMDFQMPIMDGLTATEKIRDRGITVPILGISTFGSARLPFLRAGANRFCIKPVIKEDLLEIMESLLGA